MFGKKKWILLFLVYLISFLKIQLLQAQMGCSYYQNVNYNFNFCEPVGWSKGKESDFLYTPGEFIAGWMKKDANGNAVISVFVQKPGFSIDLKKTLDTSVETIKEWYFPDSVNGFINREILEKREVVWIAAQGKGTGEQLGGGDIPTYSAWAITKIKDNNLLLFFFSSPVALHKKLISDFKQVISSLNITEEKTVKPIIPTKAKEIILPKQIYEPSETTITPTKPTKTTDIAKPTAEEYLQIIQEISKIKNQLSFLKDEQDIHKLKIEKIEQDTKEIKKELHSLKEDVLKQGLMLEDRQKDIHKKDTYLEIKYKIGIIDVDNLSEEEAKKSGIIEEYLPCVRIVRVFKNSPADKEKISEGDIILKINDTRITSKDVFNRVMEELDLKKSTMIKIRISKKGTSPPKDYKISIK